MSHCSLSNACSVLLVSVLLASASFAAAGDLPPDLTGPYMGQTPPGLTPEVFAEDMLPGDLHGCPVFTPDGMEIYWSPMAVERVFTSSGRSGEWSDPAILPFGESETSFGEPCLSPDGQLLYFVATCTSGETHRSKECVWKCEREGEGWKNPAALPDVVNATSMHWQVSVAANGNLYFHSLSSGEGDILVARFVDGQYVKPAPLHPAINTSFYEHAPFIAPDESYLIFSRVDFSSALHAELFISFKGNDGTWSEAVSMDELNHSGTNETCPNVTRDGKYLFYLGNTSKGLSAHWVDARIIDRYRPDADGQ